MKKYLVIIVVFFSVFAAGYLVSGVTSWHNSKELKKQITTLEEERRVLDVETAKLRENAEKFESLAKSKELQIDQLKSLIEKEGAVLADKQNKILEAAETYEKDIASIDSGGISDFNRCERLCKSRSELGYPCPKTYCDKYSK